MTKTVYAHADSARLAGDLSSNPFYFMPDSSWKTAAMEHPVKEWLFMDDSAVLNIYASRHYETGEASSPMQPASEDYKDSPYLNPSEKWNRKRGFFFNTYEYSCRFSGLRDKMPVPIDSFMSEQEIHDWLTEPDNLSGMNGVEIYNMVLSTLTDKFADWYNSCYIKVYCDFIAEAAGNTLSTAQKEEISGRIRKTYDFIDDRVFDDHSVSKVASVMTDVTGNPAFVRAAATRRQQLTDTLSAIETAYMMPMTTAFVYKVHMPGRLTYANTDIKDQGVPVWKVDGYRLLAGRRGHRSHLAPRQPPRLHHHRPRHHSRCRLHPPSPPLLTPRTNTHADPPLLSHTHRTAGMGPQAWDRRYLPPSTDCRKTWQHILTSSKNDKPLIICWLQFCSNVRMTQPAKSLFSPS